MKFVIINTVYKSQNLCYYTNHGFKLKSASYKSVRDDNQYHFNKDQLDKFIHKMNKMFGIHWQNPKSPIQILSLTDYKKKYKHADNKKSSRQMTEDQQRRLIDHVADLAYGALSNDDNSRLMHYKMLFPTFMADRIETVFGISVVFNHNQRQNRLCDVSSFWIPEEQHPEILVSNDMHDMGQRWGMAHALGHIFLEWHWYKGCDLYDDPHMKQILLHQHNCLCMCKLPQMAKVY